MRIGHRANLYVRRKVGKSILLLLIMALLFSVVIIGLLLYHTTDLAIQQTRQTFGGSFRIAPDMQNPGNVRVTEANGQTSVAYIGAPLDEAVIQAVLAKQEINAFNAVLRGEMLLQADLKLIDHNGIYQDDPIAAHLVSVEADTDPLLSTSFQNGRLRLTEGEQIFMERSGWAIISETLAKENGLNIGDEIQLSPRESRNGDAIAVEISGFFLVETTQQNTDVAAPYHLLENRIFFDIASGRTLMGASGADYVDFLISDPAEVYQIIDGIRNIDGIEWDNFAIAASVEEYEKAAGPLSSMMELAKTLLTIMVIISIAVLSLIQTLFNKSRQHELGIMLSVGIRAVDILFQRFIEIILIAAAALALSACTMLLSWPFIYESMSGIAEPLGAASTIAILAMTAGCGILVLIISTALSNIGVIRLKPKEILSKLS